MNDFNKTFVLAFYNFYNSFQKIELNSVNCDKKKYVSLKCMQFSKDDVINISMTEFTVKEVTVFRVVTFLDEALRQK